MTWLLISHMYGTDSLLDSLKCFAGFFPRKDSVSQWSVPSGHVDQFLERLLLLWSFLCLLLETKCFLGLNCIYVSLFLFHGITAPSLLLSCWLNSCGILLLDNVKVFYYLDDGWFLKETFFLWCQCYWICGALLEIMFCVKRHCSERWFLWSELCFLVSKCCFYFISAGHLFFFLFMIHLNVTSKYFSGLNFLKSLLFFWMIDSVRKCFSVQVSI